MRSNRLKLGLFIAPFHALNDNPTLCLERDLQLASYCEEIGLAEVWYGEHHSGGYEIIASPELMVAAAAQRTSRIRLGTGVISLPYHNPLTTANRIVQLDHLTRGRFLFGAGPGLLSADAHMLGIDPRESRDKMAAAIDVIQRLLRGEWVTEKSSWYDLRDAHCHLLPCSEAIEAAVASTMSPNGGKLAARIGAGMLCLAATTPDGFDTLAANWKVACDTAAGLGRAMNPDTVRCATDMHIAETRSEALAQVREGFEITRRYFLNQTGSSASTGLEASLEELIERGEVVVGTPDDAVAQIRRLEQKVPDFGTLLLFDKNWAGTEHKKRSLELFMRYVLPEINGSNASRQKSFDWQSAHADEYFRTMQEATQLAFARHEAEQRGT